MKRLILLMISGVLMFGGCGKSDGPEKGKDKDKGKEPVLTITVDGITFKMIYVEGGSFDMGATPEQGVTEEMNAYRNETPVHKVTLDGYYIGETEVTQELWTHIMQGNPCTFQDNKNNPVDKADWLSCQNFIKKLNQATGKKFRLPTEAEWEFAARGGNKGKGCKYSGSNDFNAVAWLKDNSGDRTHPVKTKAPNELGIYDMSGNVFEWCQDMQGYYTTSMPVVNPTGPKDYGDEPQYHIFRGGCCHLTAWYCRNSYREVRSNPTYAAYYTGLRLAL